MSSKISDPNESIKLTKSSELYDEYNKITNIIQNIQNKINKYTNDVELYIENTKNNKDKENKIREYRQTLKSIKEDKNIFEQYHLLIKRQNELKLILKIDNSDGINLLNDKYNKKDFFTNAFDIFDENEISDIDFQIKRSIQNIKLNMLSNKIKNFN
jgi:hypothetical protein